MIKMVDFRIFAFRISHHFFLSADYKVIAEGLRITFAPPPLTSTDLIEIGSENASYVTFDDLSHMTLIL
jgi:hypothetical protein